MNFFSSVWDSLLLLLDETVWRVVILAIVTILIIVLVRFIWKWRKQQAQQKLLAKVKFVCLSIIPPHQTFSPFDQARAFLSQLPERIALLSAVKNFSLELVVTQDKLEILLATPEALAGPVTEMLKTVYTGIRVDEVKDYTEDPAWEEAIDFVRTGTVEIADILSPLKLPEEITEHSSFFTFVENLSEQLQLQEKLTIQCCFSPSDASWKKKIDQKIEALTTGKNTKTPTFNFLGLLGGILKELASIITTAPQQLVTTGEGGGDAAPAAEISAAELSPEVVEKIRLLELKKSSLTGYKTAFRFIIESLASKKQEFFLDELHRYFQECIRFPDNSIIFKKNSLAPEEFFKAYQKRQPMPTSFLLGDAEIANFVYLPINEPLKKIEVTSDTSGKFIPPTLLDAEKESPLIKIGKVMSGEKEISFGIKPDKLARGLVMIGPKGQGKTTLMQQVVHQHMTHETAKYIVFDPKGDLTVQLLEKLSQQQDLQVLLLDMGNAEHLKLLAGNPLAASPFPDITKRTFIELFKRLYPDAMGPVKESILEYLLDTLQEVGGSIYDIPPILTNPLYREHFVRLLKTPKLVHFWSKEFPKVEPQLLSQLHDPFLQQHDFLSWASSVSLIGTRAPSPLFSKLFGHYDVIIIETSRRKLNPQETLLLGSSLLLEVLAAVIGHKPSPLIQPHKLRTFVVADDLHLLFANALAELFPRFEEELSLLFSTDASVTTIDGFLAESKKSAYNEVIFQLPAEFHDRIHEHDSTLSPALLSLLKNHDIVSRLHFNDKLSLPFKARTSLEGQQNSLEYLKQFFVHPTGAKRSVHSLSDLFSQQK
ncbi:MAG: hypothetical protein WCP97_03705 [bacterium]